MPEAIVRKTLFRTAHGSKEQDGDWVESQNVGQEESQEFDVRVDERRHRLEQRSEFNRLLQELQLTLPSSDEGSDMENEQGRTIDMGGTDSAQQPRGKKRKRTVRPFPLRILETVSSFPFLSCLFDLKSLSRIINLTRRTYHLADIRLINVPTDLHFPPRLMMSSISRTMIFDLHRCPFRILCNIQTLRARVCRQPLLQITIVPIGNIQAEEGKDYVEDPVLVLSPMSWSLKNHIRRR